jgi:hypothetical protein
MSINPDSLAALTSLRRNLIRAAADLKLDPGQGVDHWVQTLDHKLLPRFKEDFPIIAAICGGGSTGKSTLFNTVAGETISPTGGRAGINRRVLVAARRMRAKDTDLLAFLGHTFGGTPQPLQNPQQLLSPGEPLYCTSDQLPARVVLLDTPDIDTGADGRYANRDLARQSLEVADVFVYIFTNATYNNLDNTEFIAHMLTGMGTRPCYLVYRVYPSFSDDEVRDHARTVIHNIYGPKGSEHVWGIFRADEDNGVAAGRQPMALHAVDGGQADLGAALAAIDPKPLRSRLLSSMFDSAANQARQMAENVKQAKAHLDQYANAMETAQSRCLQTALSHIPTDRVLRRFAHIWLESDPAHIKFMRGAGKVVEWPLKTVLKTIRRINDPGALNKPPSSEEKLSRQLEMDLLSAANQLYKVSAGTDILVADSNVTAPPVVRDAQRRLRKKPWQQTVETITAQKQKVLSWSRQLDTELKALADELRNRMGVVDQIRQTFAAMLNVIPATAAITYILHTGDAVGAAGIKVKLTGLFGLHDLYALIAIPATAGMTKADRKQLEQMLGPLARTWLAHKLKVVQALFEEEISGEVLETLRNARTRTGDRIREIEEALLKLKPTI